MPHPGCIHPKSAFLPHRMHLRRAGSRFLPIVDPHVWLGLRIRFHWQSWVGASSPSPPKLPCMLCVTLPELPLARVSPSGSQVGSYDRPLRTELIAPGSWLPSCRPLTSNPRCAACSAAPRSLVMNTKTSRPGRVILIHGSPGPSSSARRPSTRSRNVGPAACIRHCISSLAVHISSRIPRSLAERCLISPFRASTVACIDSTSRLSLARACLTVRNNSMDELTIRNLLAMRACAAFSLMPAGNGARSSSTFCATFALTFSSSIRSRLKRPASRRSCSISAPMPPHAVTSFASSRSYLRTTSRISSAAWTSGGTTPA